MTVDSETTPGLDSSAALILKRFNLKLNYRLDISIWSTWHYGSQYLQLTRHFSQNLCQKIIFDYNFRIQKSDNYIAPCDTDRSPCTLARKMKMKMEVVKAEEEVMVVEVMLVVVHFLCNATPTLSRDLVQ